IYLNINSYNPDSTGIRNAVVIVAIGAFITRLIAYYFNIPNLKFRSDPKTKIHKEQESLDESPPATKVEPPKA
ncbi:MAG: hypothetical protein NWS20_00995, partial [Rickettsiaceae bacterium]|nr:hypothetical protein [Rickettsiaceae bacterium]MDP5021221.1 hypothetical protein [Rickettsiaceae bacterium]